MTLTLTTGTIALNTNTSTLNFNQSDALSANKTISGIGRVNQNGVGTTTLTNANTYAGGTTVTSGTLALSGSGTFGTGTVTSSGGTINLGGKSITNTLGALTGGGTVNNGTFTNNGSTYDVQKGSVGAVLAGTNTLTKSTSNTVTLNGGTLRNNSSANYTGALTFTSGTVGGTNLNGSLGGLTIGAGQTLSPGNSPGTASTTSQTWTGGGTYVWEINNATGTAGADPGWDLLSGTVALTITATSGSKFNIAITSLDLTNAAGNATNFNRLTTNYQWKIADFLSAISLDATAFNLNTSAFSNTVAAGSTWAIVLGNAPGITGGDNTQLWVTYSIPEPATWALLAFSLTTVMVLRRRRRN